jgi:hypothetical protein
LELRYKIQIPYEASSPENRGGFFLFITIGIWGYNHHFLSCCLMWNELIGGMKLDN